MRLNVWRKGWGKLLVLPLLFAWAASAAGHSLQQGQDAASRAGCHCKLPGKIRRTPPKSCDSAFSHSQRPDRASGAGDVPVAVLAYGPGLSLPLDTADPVRTDVQALQTKARRAPPNKPPRCL